MTRSLIVTFLVVAAVVGCKKTPVVVVPTDPEAVRFSLVNNQTANAQQSATRAVANDEFLSSSIIGIFASEATITDLSTALNTNVGYANQTGSSVWTTTVVGDPILFLPKDGAMNFYAYHPHTVQGGSSVTLDGTTLRYTLLTDQSSVEKLKAADLMWGHSLNRHQSDGTIDIAFSHILSKINLKITKGADWGDEEVSLKGVGISGTNIIKTASLSVASGEMTIGSMMPGEQGSITCDMATSRRLDALNETAVHFIVIPGNAQGTKLDFTVGDGSVSYSTVIDANMSYKTATQLNIGIVINKKSPVNIFINPVIEPWNYVSQVDIEGI